MIARSFSFRITSRAVRPFEHLGNVHLVDGRSFPNLDGHARKLGVGAFPRAEVPMPERASITLLAVGLAAIGVLRRRLQA